MFNDDDSVGYRKPPRDTRFKKGVSGNPRGRPRGSSNIAKLVHRTLRERVAIQENGRRRFITKAAAIAKQLVLKAASGNLRALDQVTRLHRAAEEAMRVEIEQTENLEMLTTEQLERIVLKYMPKKDREEFGITQAQLVGVDD
jgi:hypothetical protein